jgi:hypothetical protein
MAKIMGIAALLCLVTGPIPAFAFDQAKCNQHCAVNCAEKGNYCQINCAHRCSQGGHGSSAIPAR